MLFAGGAVAVLAVASNPGLAVAFCIGVLAAIGVRIAQIRRTGRNTGTEDPGQVTNSIA